MTSEFFVTHADVLHMFRMLGVNEMQGVHKQALAASARVLVKDARLKLAGVTGRSRSTRTADRRGWSRIKGKGRIGALNDGVRYYVSRNVDFAKVHIMGDFRLKFFEMGAGYINPRITRKKQDRGIMSPRPFFAPAINAARGKMIEAMRKTIVDAVKKRAKQ